MTLKIYDLRHLERKSVFQSETLMTPGYWSEGLLLATTGAGTGATTHLPSAATDTVKSRNCCSLGLTHIHSEQAHTHVEQHWKMSTSNQIFQLLVPLLSLSFSPALSPFFAPLLPASPQQEGPCHPGSAQGFFLLIGMLGFATVALETILSATDT